MGQHQFFVLKNLAGELLELENDIISNMKLEYSFDYGKFIITFKVLDEEFKYCNQPEITISYFDDLTLVKDFNNIIDIFDSDAVRNMIINFIKNLIEVDSCDYYEHNQIDDVNITGYLSIEAS